jgi:D-glycero-D-manno-heptose 1,7-bisphosphate phosphatase
MRDWPPRVSPIYGTAVFLDRDGTINVDTHYPHLEEELVLLPGTAEALRLLAALPIHVIVVSNQAGIALGLYDREAMSQFNAELRRQVVDAGGRIDAFYFCPFKEAKNLLPGEHLSECSKPNPGMLLEAAQEFDLDLAVSCLVGDKRGDIEAGRRVGCYTILVKTGKAGEGEPDLLSEPDAVAEDLLRAVYLIQARIATLSSKQVNRSLADRRSPR